MAVCLRQRVRDRRPPRSGANQRFLHGKGRYVADMKMAGMLEMAFLRSPMACAHSPRRQAGRQPRVFLAADLGDVSGIRADSGLPGFRIRCSLS